MNPEMHERARMAIALAGPEPLESAEQAWLASHLAACAECRSSAEHMRETAGAMRSFPLSAGRALVLATQQRVRERALQLQRERERMWVVAACCFAVTLATVLTTALAWGGMEWIGHGALSASLFWPVSLAVLVVMPAVLAGLLMLARGTYFAEHEDSIRS